MESSMIFTVLVEKLDPLYERCVELVKNNEYTN
jgi:hypothetical protein